MQLATAARADDCQRCAMRWSASRSDYAGKWARSFEIAMISPGFRDRRKSFDVCYSNETRDALYESESNLLTQIFARLGQLRGARAAFLMKRNRRGPHECGKRNGHPETRQRRITLRAGFIAKVAVLKKRFPCSFGQFFLSEISNARIVVGVLFGRGISGNLSCESEWMHLQVRWSVA